MRAILAFFALMFSAALPVAAAPMRSLDPPTAHPPGYLSTSAATTAAPAIAGEQAMIGNRPADGDRMSLLDNSGPSLGGNNTYVDDVGAHDALEHAGRTDP